MAFSCIFFMRVLILCFGIFSLVSFSMECSWMAPLTPAVMVISGLTFQPLFCMLLISGSYLVCLWVRASSGNLSWQYVNSINWIVWLGEGIMGMVFGCGLLLCTICQVLVWLGIGILFVSMCMLGAILGLCCLVVDCCGYPH